MPLSNTRSKTVSFPFIGLTILAVLGLSLGLYLLPPALIPMLTLLLLIAIPLLIMFAVGFAYTCCPKDKLSSTAFDTPQHLEKLGLRPASAAGPGSRAEVTGAVMARASMPEGNDRGNSAGTSNPLGGEGETSTLLAPALTS